LCALNNGRDLLVTGYVEDKNQLFASCTAFVVPLRIGGGTRLKILEAMAFGRPVVSTTIGCEGIDVTPGEDILVADTPQDFAAACIDLLADEKQRQALGRAGRQLVERRYRWEAIRSGYVKALQNSFIKARYSTPPQSQSTPESAERERA
jgi:glycosyltransferase involved in cell wall biosynthesis